MTGAGKIIFLVIKPRGVTLVQWVIFVPGRFLEEKTRRFKV